ncbi:Replicative DNA helicase [Candidatus Gromoviella agglomerans]|nr:Replicative DNA helicase [Candidatus Gromoviella agglomerans]
MNSLTNHKLPSFIDAEKALIGTILYDNNCIEKVSDILKGMHFFIPLHGKMYDFCYQIIHRGQVVDPFVLMRFFAEDESLISFGGQEYIGDMISSFISISQAETYAQQIYDAYIRREIIRLFDEAIHRASHLTIEDPYQKQMDDVTERLFLLMEGNDQKTQPIPFYQHLSSAIKNAELAFKRETHIIGTTTGLIDLDKLLGGLHPSDLIILAGRPSMGKTALATNIAFNAAIDIKNNKKCVAFFSLEMSSEQLALRILGQESGISSDRIRRGAISQDNFISFIDVSKKLSDLQLYVDDSAVLSIPILRGKLRKLARKTSIDLIVIDYIQLMITDTRSENRVQQLSEISRGLKGIAKEFNTPVLGLSQLSRAVEQREDKKPQLSDLRESGSIEQDADVVMFIYREEYYKSRAKPAEGSHDFFEWQKQMNEIYNIAEIIIAKQRHGPIDSVKLHFDAKLTKFSNLLKS